MEPTVYIIDDDEAVRDSLRILLESHHYRVEEFESGQAFLDRYRPGLRGCIVLDINLPELDGFAVLKRLGNPYVKLPVIMITGRADSTTAARARAAGAAAFIEKPFAGEQMLRLVRESLR